MKRPIARYAPDTDSLFLRVRDGQSVETEEVADQVLISYDAEGQVVTIEIEGHASEILKEFADYFGRASQARKAKSA